jgi:hypothetical protein
LFLVLSLRSRETTAATQKRYVADEAARRKTRTAAAVAKEEKPRKLGLAAPAGEER